jgi:polyhydroxybutyrate depolymerase
MMLRFLVLGLALVLGCGSDDALSGTGGSSGIGGDAGTGGQAGMAGSGGEFAPDPPLEIGPSDRPASVSIPSDYDPEVSYPLLFVLHGAGANGSVQASYFGLPPLVDSKQFVMVYPDGTPNESNSLRWNGAGCCTTEDSPDDVSYLSGLIEEALRTYNTDAKRVYLMGHSNGGFMSFRLGCEAATLFTAMMSLAGSTWNDPEDCAPGTPPVSVLVVHGTADGTISYEGTAYPGAVEVAERSAAAAGCDPNTTTDLGTTDYLEAVPGEETVKVAYDAGCDEGLAVELWTMTDGVHIPFLGDQFADDVTDWLFSKSR